MTNKAKVIAYVIKHNGKYVRSIKKELFGLTNVTFVSDINVAHIYEDVEKAKRDAEIIGWEVKELLEQE